MSQPPQPPQPPGHQGGPADGQPPPPPGYGYPSTPPGYGYPQQPAPPAQNPYAQQPPQPDQNPYAQQQPDQNPYAQPQQPAQPPQPPQYGYPQQAPPPNYAAPEQGWGGQPAPQAPYGYPQQPGYPTMPAPGTDGSRRQGSGKLVALIAGAVALVVIIGVGVALLTSGGGKKQAAGGTSGGSTQGTDGGNYSGPPHQLDGKLLWHAGLPKVSKAQIIADTSGVWSYGPNVIKQDTTSVNAYDLASGAKRWSVPTTGHTCNAAPTMVGTKVAVQYGTKCQDIMVIDVSKGTVVWHKEIDFAANSDSYALSDLDMAVSGNGVALTWDQQYSVAYNLTTGSETWHSKPGDKCADVGLAGGEQMIEVYKCGYDDKSPTYARLIDPMTGKAKWTWQAPAGTKISNVVSTKPVVVGIAAGNELITDVWNIDGGHLSGKISLGGGSDGQNKYAINCPPTRMGPCRDVVVTGDTIYMATAQHSGDSYGLVNEIAAFNLQNGSAKWLSKSGGESLMDLVSLEGDSLIAYQESTFDAPGKILKVKTADGSVSTYTDFSAQTQDQEHKAFGYSSYMNEIWYNDYLILSMSEVGTSTTDGSLIAVLR